MTSVESAPPPSVPDGPVPILEVHDLVKEFPVRSGFFRRQVGAVHAVSGVSFSVYPGRTLGIVGESGSGKSMTGLALLGLLPAAGQIAGGISMT